jgi:hypothetical protein
MFVICFGIIFGEADSFSLRIITILATYFFNCFVLGLTIVIALDFWLGFSLF